MKPRPAVAALAALALLVVVVGLSVTSLAAQTPPAAPAAQAAPAPAAAGRGGGGAPATCGPNPPAELKNVAKDSRCFELRTYTLRPGGVGDLDLLHRRFREHSMRILTKHGMTIVGFWQPVAKPDALTYLVAYKDAAARNTAWAEFQADPEWVKVRTDMNVSVTVESIFMIATDYGPLK